MWIALAVVMTAVAQGGGRLAKLRERRASAKVTNVSAPGDYRFQIRHDGHQREYLLHVPKAWQPGTSLPVVLALHGGGGSADYMADEENYGLVSKAESAGFLAVFPNGISPVRSGMLATWNAGLCCGAARDRQIDDVGFLKEVIADVIRKTGADRTRVFSIGMSNGALMSYRLACEASGLLRGIMAVAGTDNTQECQPLRPVPVLHIHARNDDHVLFDGGAGNTFRDPKTVTNFTSVPATVAKWVKLNRANPQPRRVLNVPGAYCDLHEAGRVGAPVKLCVTETGMHSWPGGQKSRAPEPPSQAIRANDLMWEFFQSL